MSVVGPKDGSREAWDDYMTRFKSDLDRKTLNDLQERVIVLEATVARLVKVIDAPEMTNEILDWTDVQN